MQKTIDTIIFPRWVVPVEPYNVYYENYAVAVDAGRIVDILPKNAAQEKYQAKEIIDLGEHVILPGFVNAHTHSPMTYFRGLGDDLPLMTWLTEYVWPAENKWLSDEFVRDATEFALVEMLKCGTTCFQEHYLFPLSIANVAKEAKIRALIGMFIIGAKTAWGNDPEDYIAKGLELYQHYKNDELVRVNLAPHAPYTLDDAALKRVNELAHEYNLSIHMHLHESVYEVDSYCKESAKRPLQRLAELGLFEHKFQAVHMVHLNADDFALLKQYKNNVSVIHCPVSNLKLANGVCPVPKLLAEGTNVALGTDSAASNNTLDMFLEMRTMANLAKGISANPIVVPAAEALQIATLNGARALGLENEIGSIVPGKSADLIAVDFSYYNTQPVYNPISHLVYAANARQVTDVWVAGRRILDCGKLTTLDEERIMAKAKEWGRRINTIS